MSVNVASSLRTNEDRIFSSGSVPELLGRLTSVSDGLPTFSHASIAENTDKSLLFVYSSPAVTLADRLLNLPAGNSDERSTKDEPKRYFRNQVSAAQAGLLLEMGGSPNWKSCGSPPNSNVCH